MTLVSQLSIRNTSKKPVCLIVFKFPSNWNHHLVRNFSRAYHIESLYAHEIFLKCGTGGLRERLNRKILDTSAEVVIFDLDYYYLFDLSLITSVGAHTRKVLITFDDISLHRINSINATVCNIVLTADPVSALKYEEIDVDAQYFSLEASKDIYFDRNLDRDIDVLFFGSLKKADRQEYVDYLVSKGINMHLIGPERGYVSHEVLAEYINRSKIVVNFSKTDYSETVDLGISHVHRFYHQFKGRVIEAGLCRTACVSEYSPALRLLFSPHEVPEFRTREECYERLVSLLENEKLREGFAERLYAKTMSEYEDSAQISAIEVAIGRANKEIRPRLAVPLWYWRLTLRSKIKFLKRSPWLILKEIVYVLRSGGIENKWIKTRLVIEIFFWVPWHYSVSIVSRFSPALDR